MELSALRAFIDVMRRGSFAAVARANDVAPSSVSRQIAALEDELGVRLFQRTTRSLSPTEAGRIYFERVEPLVDELEHARLLASDASDQPKGTLRVTAPVSFAQLTLVPLLPSLMDAYPELSVELVLSDAMLDLLEERIDVAVRLGRLDDSGFVARRLCSMRFVVCASPDYLRQHGTPEKPDDLDRHQCITFLMGGYRSRWWFRKRKKVEEVSIGGRLTVSNALAIRRCASEGMGICLLPSWVVSDAIRKGELIEILTDYEVTATSFDSAAWVVFPSRSYVPLKVRAFVDFLVSHYQTGPPWEAAG